MNEEVTQESNSSQARLSIPGDTVKIALTKMREKGTLNEADESLVWWFYCHCRDKRFSLAESAEAISYDSTTVHRLFNGTYGAKLDKVVEAITRYKKIASERSKRRDIGFIETSTWRKISQVCDSAFYDSMPAFIYGASQIGKTECLKEYAERNNHGQTKYIRMPASPSFPFFLKTVARACFISDRQNNDITRHRIMEALDEKNIILIDEVHQALITVTESTARKIIEFLREVYDRTGCGIVLCGTNVFRDEFERGRQKMIFEQFRRRGMLELVLPDTPPKSDIIKIAKSFELDEPSDRVFDTIKSMLQESGLGKYIKFLQYANGVAVSRKEQITWDHFLAAYDGIKKLSQTTK
jgi:DNA transposition AAA+ family ATPase